MAKNIKGIVYRDEYFLETYQRMYFLYMHWKFLQFFVS
jgi:hypothetical protein